MHETAKRALVAVVVGGGVVVLALALWRLKILIALLFLGFIIAAAMRPGIEALARRGIPRAGTYARRPGREARPASSSTTSASAPRSG